MTLPATRLLAITIVAGLATSAVAEPTIKPQAHLAAALAAAKPLQVETLAEGPDTAREGALWWVPNPDGKTWDIVFMYNETYGGPHEVFAFDTATKELKTFQIPGRDTGFHIVPYLLIGGKLIIKPGIGAPDVNVWTYDPATNELAFGGYPLGKGVAAGDGTIAPNDDGSLIGGFSPLAGDKQAAMRAGFYTIDPVTLKGEFLGSVGSENPNLFWEYGGTIMDGDWIYARVAHTPWRLLGMNVKTKQGRVIAETERIMGDRKTITFNTNPDYPGVYVEITAFKGDPLDTTRSFWLRDGELTPCDPIQKGRELIPPWQAEKRATPRRNFYGRMEGASNPPPGMQIRREPVASDGTVKIWWRYTDTGLAAATHVEPNAWQRIAMPTITSYPVPIRHMAALPDGSILGIGEAYARAVRFDPRTKKRTPLSQTLSTYSVLPFEQKVYICGYPSSELWVYDPARPWTVGQPNEGPPAADAPALSNQANAARADTNPTRLALLKDFTDVHLPWASAIGGDGRIYFGGKVVRIGNGGGLGWWDTRKQEAGGFHEPFDRDAIFWMCAADKGRFIVCSTKPVAGRNDPDYVPPRGRLFVYDTTKRELVHTVDDERLERFPGFITEATPGLVMGYAPRKEEAEGGLLYGFDPAAGKIVWTKSVPFPPQTGKSLMKRGRWEFDRGPDGFIWTFMGDALVRIDPQTAEVHPFGTLEQDPLLFVAGDIYVAGGLQFRRITGIPKVDAVKQ